MIKKIIFLLLLTVGWIVGCNSTETIPNTDMDVARAFIKNILEDKFDIAEQFILKDEINQEYFTLFKEKYHRKSKAELDNFKNADIIIHEIENVNDSISIINYSNSYKKESRSIIKTIRRNGKWWVDFKYTFSGNL